MIRVETEKKATHAKAQSELVQEPKKKPGMDELLTLPNVNVRPKRLKSYHKHRQIGLDKVINFALAERDLESQRKKKWPYKNAHAPMGSNKVLAFGEPIPAMVVRELEREREGKEKAMRDRREQYAA